MLQAACTASHRYVMMGPLFAPLVYTVPSLLANTAKLMQTHLFMSMMSIQSYNIGCSFMQQSSAQSLSSLTINLPCCCHIHRLSTSFTNIFAVTPVCSVFSAVKVSTSAVAVCCCNHCWHWHACGLAGFGAGSSHCHNLICSCIFYLQGRQVL